MADLKLTYLQNPNQLPVRNVPAAKLAAQFHQLLFVTAFVRSLLGIGHHNVIRAVQTEDQALEHRSVRP